ncbi:OsmC family protein [Draconibacterium halophilum]|uniref:OsmC family protein n=1 Tax=Draconibacterium halophilum TaxID=2706887 RepID=A0A6C0RG96_9BACT|nr:OsmC family protein [Draconibacterium halophilum]QIA09087.1 OsmC family protein [Draconibacterium halophilum]
MKKRKAQAKWNGNLKKGNGLIKLPTSNQEFPFNFSSRFEDGKGSNPEELIAAAHAGCFSMAFSGLLTEKGYNPELIETKAEVTIEKVGDGFKITKSALDTEGKIPEIKEDEFLKLAQTAKENCPVSQALDSLEITLNAKLV